MIKRQKRRGKGRGRGRRRRWIAYLCWLAGAQLLDERVDIACKTSTLPPQLLKDSCMFCFVLFCFVVICCIFSKLI